jgi:hypothetical protein
MKAWTAAQLDSDTAVALLAKAFTSRSWSHTIGDHVSVAKVRLGVEDLNDVVNEADFKARVEELARSGTLASPYREYVLEFHRALSAKGQGDDR